MQEPTQKEFILACLCRFYNDNDMPEEYKLANDKVQKYLYQKEMQEFLNLHLHIRLKKKR
jgi:hypothetical protein